MKTEPNLYLLSIAVVIVAAVVLNLLDRNRKDRFRIKDYGWVRLASDAERQRNREWAEKLGGNNDHLH